MTKKFTAVLLSILLLSANMPVGAESLSLSTKKKKKSTSSVPLNTEKPSLTPTQAAEQFYKERAKKLLKDGVKAQTYEQKYNHITGSVYPPTFWSDKIKDVPPYDTEGVLWTFALRETYDTLKDAAPLDIPSVVDKTLVYLVLHTRDVDVAKISPFYEKKGDPWFTAFALMGQYDQLGQFVTKYDDLRGLYKECQRYRKTNDLDMIRYCYSHYDFTPLEEKIDLKVFSNREKDIKSFARELSNTGYAFLSRVIVPLQTNSVPNADVSRYLDAHLSDEGLPQGLSRAQLKAVIMEKMESPEDYLAEAEEINPSIGKEVEQTFAAIPELVEKNRSGEASAEITAAFNEAKAMREKGVAFGSRFFKTTGKVFKGTGLPKALGKLLSLFQYVAPSTYINMLMNCQDGKCTHEQVNKALAESLAAEALDKRLAQIANGLFEMERIFAYNTASVEDGTIAKNWQRLALNDTYSSFMIARLAADNIMKSGKTQYQTNAVAAMQLENRKMENAKTNASVLLFAVDFLPLGGLGAVSIDEQLAAKAAQAEKQAARAARMAARAEKENVLLAKRGLYSLEVEGQVGNRAAQTGKKGQQVADVRKGTKKGGTKEVVLSSKTKVATQEGGVPYESMSYAEARDLIRARAQATPAGQPVDLSDLRMTDDIMSRVSETPSAISPAKLESSVTGPLDNAVKGAAAPVVKIEDKAKYLAKAQEAEEKAAALRAGAKKQAERNAFNASAKGSSKETQNAIRQRTLTEIEQEAQKWDDIAKTNREAAQTATRLEQEAAQARLAQARKVEEAEREMAKVRQANPARDTYWDVLQQDASSYSSDYWDEVAKKLKEAKDQEYAKVAQGKANEARKLEAARAKSLADATRKADKATDMKSLGDMNQQEAWKALVPDSKEGLPALHNGASTFTEEVRIHKGLTNRLLDTQNEVSRSAQKLERAMDALPSKDVFTAQYKERLGQVVRKVKDFAWDSQLSQELREVQNLVERVASREVPLVEKKVLYQQISQKYDGIFHKLSGVRDEVRSAQSWAQRAAERLDPSATGWIDERLQHLDGLILDDTQRIEQLSRTHLSVVERHISGIEQKAANKVARVERRAAKQATKDANRARAAEQPAAAKQVEQKQVAATKQAEQRGTSAAKQAEQRGTSAAKQAEQEGSTVTAKRASEQDRIAESHYWNELAARGPQPVPQKFKNTVNHSDLFKAEMEEFQGFLWYSKHDKASELGYRIDDIIERINTFTREYAGLEDGIDLMRYQDIALLNARQIELEKKSQRLLDELISFRTSLMKQERLYESSSELLRAGGDSYLRFNEMRNKVDSFIAVVKGL